MHRLPAPSPDETPELHRTAASREKTFPRGLPTLYSAQEVADALGCSLWWVRDRARRGLIPHTRVADSYKFTAEHVAEIVRFHEKRPAQPTRPAPAPQVAPTSTAPRAVPPQAPTAAEVSRDAFASVAVLSAKPPRRAVRRERDAA